VPTPANSQHVDERLEELYRRHLLVGEDSVANYYESGRGHYKPELAAEERNRFSICIVRTDGKVHQAGDHDRPRVRIAWERHRLRDLVDQPARQHVVRPRRRDSAGGENSHEDTPGRVDRSRRGWAADHIPADIAIHPATAASVPDRLLSQHN